MPATRKRNPSGIAQWPESVIVAHGGFARYAATAQRGIPNLARASMAAIIFETSSNPVRAEGLPILNVKIL
jgi:hypothetical protein